MCLCLCMVLHFFYDELFYSQFCAIVVIIIIIIFFEFILIWLTQKKSTFYIEGSARMAHITFYSIRNDPDCTNCTWISFYFLHCSVSH